MNNVKTRNRRWHSRFHSFGYAFEGMRHALLHEANMRIHLLAAIVIIIAGFIRHISKWQWAAILICIAFVWVAELFNTCIERLCDMYGGNAYNTTIKIIKDVAAAAVLVASLASAIVGIIIFIS